MSVVCEESDKTNLQLHIMQFSSVGKIPTYRSDALGMSQHPVEKWKSRNGQWKQWRLSGIIRLYSDFTSISLICGRFRNDSRKYKWRNSAYVSVSINDCDHH